MDIYYDIGRIKKSGGSTAGAIANLHPREGRLDGMGRPPAETKMPEVQDGPLRNSSDLIPQRFMICCRL